MKRMGFSHRSILTTLMALSIGVFVSATTHAEIRIHEPGTARISWGDADSLAQARTIMYGNNSSGSSVNTTIRRIDNGYGDTNTIPNPNPSYNDYNTYSNNYSTTYNNNYNSNYNSNNYYDQLAISTGSRGVLVYDMVSNQPIYEKNADIARPIASISKLLTAMVILDAGQPMNEEIIISHADVAKRYYSHHEKTSSTKFKVGDRLNRAEMLLMMLMKSENPAGKALARTYPGGYHAFMQAMNQKAKSLGMTGAFFGDPTGLDTRNVASPNDLVKMIKAAGEYDVIRRFTTTKNHNFFVANYSEGNRRYAANNTSYLIRDGVYPIGISKTGYIQESGRCVVMETRVNNRPAIVVLLGANSSATRWKDAENILQSLSMRRFT